MVTSIFAALKKAYTNINDAVIVTSSPYLYGDPYSTIDPGYFYSANVEEPYVKYNILYDNTIVTGYTISSMDSDIYPMKWALEGSLNDINYTTLHTSDTPLCTKYSKYYNESKKRQCTQIESQTFSISNTKIYRFYRIKMIGKNSSDEENTGIKYIFIFRQLILYGRIQFAFKKGFTCKHVRNRQTIITLLLFFIC